MNSINVGKISPKFLWGFATSAFQVEGHIDNDMTEWEQLGNFKQNDKNPYYNDAANHWLKWEEDFEILSNLQVNADRFSIEWSRIQPQPNFFDDSALSKYDRMIDRLLEKNITPVLTLFHFTHHKWFHSLSPWHSRLSIETFYTYSKKIIDKFADRIEWFITFNEPLVWTLAAYGDAKFPPGDKNLNNMMISLSHMLETHGKIYDDIKNCNPKSKIGIAKNFIIFEPLNRWNLFDIGLTHLVHTFYNQMIIKAFESNRLRFHFPFLVKYDKDVPLNNKIDFWGVNYYYRMHVHFNFDIKRPFHLLFLPKSKEGLSDLGWEIYSKRII